MYQALQKGKQILQELGPVPEVSRPAAPYAAQDPRCCINRDIISKCFLACMSSRFIAEHIAARPPLHL